MAAICLQYCGLQWPKCELGECLQLTTVCSKVVCRLLMKNLSCLLTASSLMKTEMSNIPNSQLGLIHNLQHWHFKHVTFQSWPIQQTTYAITDESNLRLFPRIDMFKKGSFVFYDMGYFEEIWFVAFFCW